MNPTDASTTLARYPAIEAPARVDAGQTFTVLVSLTDERTAVTARVVQGDTTHEGRLELALPPGERWELQVVVHAAGFSVQTDTAPLVLTRAGDSTPARFRLTADADTPPGSARQLHATLWSSDGAFLGRFTRDIRVGPAESTVAVTWPVMNAPDAGAPAARAAGAAALSSTPEGALDSRIEAPDLTIETLYGLDAAHPRRARVTVSTGGRPVQVAWWDEPDGLAEWLDAQYARLAAFRGRGIEVDTARADSPDASRAFARGLGVTLWERYAPPAVREAFWLLADDQGAGFDAIQLVSNDTVLPWELMRPTRGGEERGFIGTEFAVGRWLEAEGGRLRLRPAQQITVTGTTLVAPTYAGRGVLPAQTAERASLLARPGAREAAGTFAGVAALFREPPQGIIHFAGHGAVRADGPGAYQQVVLLEDGELDLTTWRGLVSSASSAHPFVFFNACEVGQTARAGGFVTGWAPAVLNAGASGYVGALWPLGDAAAARFAEAFYTSLDARTPARGVVALALRDARRRLYDETGDPSHLAYVYYGDPLQRLVVTAE